MSESGELKKEIDDVFEEYRKTVNNLEGLANSSAMRELNGHYGLYEKRRSSMGDNKSSLIELIEIYYSFRGRLPTLFKTGPVVGVFAQQHFDDLEILIQKYVERSGSLQCGELFRDNIGYTWSSCDNYPSGGDWEGRVSKVLGRPPCNYMYGGKWLYRHEVNIYSER